VAVGIALAPLPAVAAEVEAVSLENLSVGLEFNRLNKGLDATTAISGSARLLSPDVFAAQVDNSVDTVKLTEVLARVNYKVNDHFTPYLLLGTSGLSFDDKYKFDIASLLGADTSVPYSDSLAVGYGFGAEGVLMALPAEMTLTYGVRMFTFTSSDGAAVPPEQISSLLVQINPIEKVNFSTDVTFREWDFSVGVQREYEFDGDFTVTPQFGYRHCSISMQTSTDVEYSPGMPSYLKGTFDRSLGGSLSSVTLGVTGRFQEYIGATLQVAVGDETGMTLAVTYEF
jgi:opacity protein-like surface antigen